jgi:hypothetical protein
MDQKNIVLNSSKTLLNEEQSNDLFMQLDILLLKAEPNLNNYFFQEDFIDEIVNNQGKYAALPIVVDLEKLLSKDYLNLGHNMSPFTGKFYSQQIGSYVSFSKETGEDGIAELHGKARISKRNTDLIDVLMELYSSALGLSFSVEVIASDYSIDQNNVLLIGASPNNFLLSDALVSFPACPESQALKLVSELNRSLKGGEKLKDSKKDILSELSHSDIRSQLNDLLNPSHDSDGWRVYDYWIVATYDNYVIVSDEHKAGVYYKFEYTVNDKDEVTLGEKSQVTIEFVSVNDKGGNVNMENFDANKIIEENKKLTLENEKLSTQNEEFTATVGTLTSEKKELEVKLNEANETVVSLGKEKETLTAQVEDLTTFKTDVVEKENTAKIEAIVSEVKDTLNEEEMKLLNEAVETKDADKVKHLVNELCAKKYKETLKLTNSKDEDSFFAVSNQRDLGGDSLSKFNM